MNNLHVKTGDNVMVISGKDKGKTGKVLQTSPNCLLYTSPSPRDS